MSSRIAGNLAASGLALALGATNVSAAQQQDAKAFPHIAIMEHQQIKLGNQVIYEGDFDTAADPGPQYFLQVKVDDGTFPPYPAFKGDVGTVQGAQDRPNTVKMFNYVIRDVLPDGSAEIDLVITRRDPSKHLNQSEYIPVRLTIGQRSALVSKSGSHVAVLLQPEQQ